LLLPVTASTGCGFSTGILSRFPDNCHRLGHGNGRSSFDHVPEQGTTGARDQLHDRFIGFHLRQHITDGNRLTLLLFPFDQATLFHRG
jgi:hypothetical protein